MEKIRPKIGIGVYVLNAQNRLLLMMRKNTAGAGTWAPPGGHLEMAEGFLDCVKREAKEEVGLDIISAKLWAVNNNIAGPDWHYVNLDFLAIDWKGEPENQEPEKCKKLGWFDLGDLPRPLMLPTANFFKNNPKCLCRSGKNFNACHGKQNR